MPERLSDERVGCLAEMPVPTQTINAGYRGPLWVEVAALAREVRDLRAAVRRWTPPEATTAVLVSNELVQQLRDIPSLFVTLEIVLDDDWWTFKATPHYCPPPAPAREP